MRKILIIPLILLSGCIKLYETEVEPGSARLVVHGRITNQPGPYEVRLAWSGNYAPDITAVPLVITGAVITLFDDAGHSELFYEKTRGQYVTMQNIITGEVGKSYYITIVLANGETYRSQQETIKASPTIPAIRYEYIPESAFGKEGFDVYIDIEDPVNEMNFYKWESIYWSQYSKDCWKRVPDLNPYLILSDQEFNGKKLTGYFVKKAPYSSRLPCVVTVKQLSLSAGAFEFLDNMKDQITVSGSLFDPPPTFLRGNLYHINKPDEIVLGYFYAAGVTEKEIAIDRTLPDHQPDNYVGLEPSPLYCGDPCNWQCVVLSGGKCGLEPCPPECDTLPDVTYIPPDSWPIDHKCCDE